MSDEQKHLLAFGEVMRVLGQNAHTLAERPEYARLVSDFLEKFVPKDEENKPPVFTYRCSECFTGDIECDAPECIRCPKVLCKECRQSFDGKTLCPSCFEKIHKEASAKLHMSLN
jgi:hypothetical protein